MTSVVTALAGQLLTDGGQDVKVWVLVVRKVEVRVEAEVVEFETGMDEAEDGSPLVLVEFDATNPGQPALLMLSCTVTKSPVPLCSITTSSQLNVATTETLTPRSAISAMGDNWRNS